MSDTVRIRWYRTPVDREVMKDLMRKSDLRGFAQAVPQLLLFTGTGALSYFLFLRIDAANWIWMVPLLLLSLFLHGTNASFFGGVAGHELTHKTPFASPFWNNFFLKIFSFLGWFDPTGYRASHVRHHLATTHADHDGEIVLPQGLDWHGFWFVVKMITFDPQALWRNFRFWTSAARGRLDKDGFFKSEWLQKVVPATDLEARRAIRNWARVVLFGHLALALLFILSGHWFLIILVNLAPFYASWFTFVCGAPQHVGLSPNVPDFRLNTRTYTCGWLPAFLYWNMQYHVEHHMYPAVPFYNLPRLRKAIEHDLPPAPHGLWATWKELIPIIRRQRKEPGYTYIPPLPVSESQRSA